MWASGEGSGLFKQHYSIFAAERFMLMALAKPLLEQVSYGAPPGLTAHIKQQQSSHSFSLHF